jgi:hypothetical protein
MRISIDLPNEMIQVVDTENYKGVPVTVLRMFGEDILYYHGRESRSLPYQRTNGEWEQVFLWAITNHFRKVLLANDSVSLDWQEENPTGRELRDSSEDTLHYVRED